MAEGKDKDKDEKGINIKSDEITIDSQGRVVITNPEFKAAVELQKKDGTKSRIMGNANCYIC